MVELLTPTKEFWVPDKNLHLPKPKQRGLFVELGAWDETLKLIHQERELSRSPVKQFMQILLSQMRQKTVTSVTNTVGVSRNVYEYAANFAVNASTQPGYGIVIGTGSTVVDILDYQLVAQVTTNWVYNTMVIDAAVTVADPDCTFEMYRNFNNNTGSSVVIAEVGVYCRAWDNSLQRTYMIFRDVPASSVTVPDGGGCYVKYTLKVSE